ncbi:hypothetical protein STVA_12810 [Allostella vacuolata]|nr:hypothetical protein STVA_12810 [Stella vacuolata]
MSDPGVPAARAAVPGAGGWRRWLVPGCLLASLAFNVFLGSALLGRYTHDQARGDPGGVFPGFRSFAESLPPPSREAVRDSFRARRGELGRERRELRQARQQVMQALSADPYDAGAARRAFDTLRRADDGLARVAQEAIVEAAGKLSAEQRRELGEHRRPRTPRPPPGDAPPPGPPPGGRI